MTTLDAQQQKHHWLHEAPLAPANNNSFTAITVRTQRVGIARGSGGSRKNIWGAWPLIIWEATTAKRNLQ